MESDFIKIKIILTWFDMILGLKGYFIVGFFPNKLSYLFLLNRVNFWKN